jgi:iron(III) transport system permease protein
MGFILTFNFPNPWLAVFLIISGSLFYVFCVTSDRIQRIIIFIGGVVSGLILSCMDDGGFLFGENGLWNLSQFPQLGLSGMYYLVGGLFILLAILFRFTLGARKQGKIAFWTGLYLVFSRLVPNITNPLRIYGRSQSVRWWRAMCTQSADYLEVPFSLPTFFLGLCLIFITAMMIYEYSGKFKALIKTVLLALSIGILFTNEQMKMNGTAYVILFAFIVRSLPASVRSGIAALQQIDDSIEEASTILGGDSQYTFRKVTLPLILPALMTGLIFSFTRHMTSLSAIIFLVSSKWQIVTASIMSGWEQDGISYAATFSSVIILIVIVFIGLMGVVTRKLLKIDTNIDINAGF